MKNWAGNQTYSTNTVVAPESLEQLAELVASSNKLKPLGTRHSFNAIGDSDGTLVSLENFRQISEPDPKNHTVTIGSGITYGELANHLQPKGWALHNLASLPHISVAGACATATHGSGVKNGNLATAVVAMKMVTPKGELSSVQSPDLDHLAVHLGALGIVTELTLKIEPTYTVAQTVYLDLPFTQFTKDHLAIFASGYSVSLFTNWSNQMFDQVWVKSRPDQNTTLSTALESLTPSTTKLHPLRDLSPENCTEQLGIPGPWHERLPHFKMDFTPSAGEELQSEYFVPAHQAPDALLAVADLADQIAPALFVSELRYIAADNLLMSPAYHQDVVGIHFTWKPDWKQVKPILEKIEQNLEPFNPRPHHGKLTAGTLDPKTAYLDLPQFTQLVQKADPTGKLTNAYLESFLNL